MLLTFIVLQLFKTRKEGFSMPGLRPAYLKWRQAVRQIISGGVPAINTVSYSKGNLTFGTTDGKSIVIKNIGAKGPDQPLTSTEVSKALNNGVVPEIPGSIKGLGDGWWKLLKDNLQVTGRPSGTNGDLLILKQKAGPSSSFILVSGQDTNNKPAIWMQSRIASQWTDWVKFHTDAVTGDDLETEIQNVLRAIALMQGRIEALENAEKALTPLTIDQIETQLSAKGWGPLPKSTPIPSSKDRPSKPTGIPKVWAGYSLTFPTDLNTGLFSSTSGVLSITRTETTAERIFIVVPMPEAEDVSGIRIDDGLAAKWQSRDQTYDGKQYRVFYSDGGFNEQSNKVQVLFGNQG